MLVVADTLVGLVALVHLCIMTVEMFLWTTPRVRAAFNTTAEFAAATKALAANQGLYNGFLALALIWGLVAGGSTGSTLEIYGLACVIVAGIYGAATATRRILFVQVLPGVLALVAVLIAR